MIFIENIEFVEKYYFLLLTFLPLIWYFLAKNKNNSTISSFEDIKKTFGKSSIFFYIENILISLIFIIFVMFLADPKIGNTTQNISKSGIDIVLVFDVSLSMEAQDLKPNRIESAKKVVKDFIQKTKNDRIGLVLFAGKPFSSIPLTFDYSILQQSINEISTNSINQNIMGLNGTAIGDAILMAKNLFIKQKNQTDLEYKDRQKVIVLLTDGEANVGVEPKLASQSALKDNIKIYTIGIGSKEGGSVNINLGNFIKTEKIPPLDDKKLEEISQITNGEYFRADNNQVLENIFGKLSSLNKTKIIVSNQKSYYEYYKIFVYSLSFLIFCLFMLVSFKPKF